MSDSKWNLLGEIEGLRDELDGLVKRNEEQDAQIERLKALITELADALDGYIYWKTLPGAVEAVKKARAITQESHTGSEK